MDGIDDVQALQSEADRQSRETKEIRGQLQSQVRACEEMRQDVGTARRQIAFAEKKQRIAEARFAASQIEIREHRKEKKRKANLIRYYESKKKEWKEQANALSRASSRVQDLEAKNAFFVLYSHENRE